MEGATLFLLAIGCFATSVVATRFVLGWLLRRRILDLPNERSSHTLPTPRGGGLAVTPVALAGLGIVGFADLAPPGLIVVASATLGLFALSWFDDRRSLPAGARLMAHLLAAGAGLAAVPAEALVFQGLLPWWADRLAALLAWGWFINLYNFMDGIDGITGVETASVGLGLGMVGLIAGQADLLPPGLVLAAAACGFLVWNWHPAKLFLGDSGSVPLGYLLGWLLLVAAARGLWAPALILPLYYLADATITLGRRAAKGEKVWHAHRQHFYQRAVAAGASHHAVALGVGACNAGLVGAALLSVWAGSLLGLSAAAAVTSGFLMALWTRARQDGAQAV